MGVEIERRFLVDRLPAVDLGTGTDIRQGYLVDDGPIVVRVRRTADGDRLTIKSAAALARTEVELPLDQADAEQLWALTTGRRVHKTRHRLELDGPVAEIVAEIDVFADALDGLVVVEVEFPTTDAAGAFSPPAWFGREVTGDHRWSNASLAVHGIPR